MSVVSDTSDDWGDHVVDSDGEIDLIENAESPSRYFEGHFYALCLGDLIADRYRVEHKLGHGGFSTVWMAYDMLGKRDVALKIIIPGPEGEHEYAIQNEIASCVEDASRLLLYEDTFFIPGMHGDHRVLVFPVLGPNLRDFADKTPIKSRMSALRQLLQAINNLHEAGFIHRDLTDANCMYKLRKLPKCNTVAEKYKYTGRPRKMRVDIEPESRPQHACEIVMPMRPNESIVADDICIGDFGITIKSGTPVEQTMQSPNHFCAPELFHSGMPTFAADMWSFFCIFADLYMNVRLFGVGPNWLVAGCMVRALGSFPESWKGTYSAGTSKDTWYDPNEKTDRGLALERGLSHRRPDISERERHLVLSIFQRGFSYDPEHRWTAAQLLEDTSFQEFMSLYGL